MGVIKAMSEETALTLTDEAEPNLRLIAFDPAQLQLSQEQLIFWVDRKIASVRKEGAEYKQNVEIARKSKWSMARPKAAMDRSAKRLTFYMKIKDALVAGYYIVPGFPCDVFAIRTERSRPLSNTVMSSYPNNYSSVLNEQAQIRPSGQGDYKNPQQLIHRRARSYKDSAGKQVDDFVYRAVDFRELDFPFAWAKPEILEATQRAMALKIFDEIGVAPAGSIRSTKLDPMVLGIIKMPKVGYKEKKITFLVAWFLDTETL